MIVYKNGRLVQDTTAEQEMRASAIRTAAKDEGAARLAGLKAAQKTQASALKRIEAGKSPSVINPETGKITTSAGATGTTGKTGSTGSGSTKAADTSAADKALAEAQERRRRYFAGLDAATALETQGKSAAEKALEALAGIYDPQIADVESQREKQLQLLADAITQGKTDITDAEAKFLEGIVAPTAYENIPFVGLSQEQNPLLAALQAQGAGTAEVESQRALDAALASSLKSLSERAAAQTAQADKNYFTALKNAGLGVSQAGRTYLGQRQPEIQAALESQFSDLANELRTARAKSEADVQSQLQDVLTEAIKSRGETTADYGPLNTVINAGTTGANTPVVSREDVTPFKQPDKKKLDALRAIAGLASTIEGR
jgi:hypothetical protein